MRGLNISQIFGLASGARSNLVRNAGAYTGCAVESWKNTGLASGVRSNLGEILDLAPGAWSNLGEIRGLHRVCGRILEKCDASHPV